MLMSKMKERSTTRSILFVICQHGSYRYFKPLWEKWNRDKNEFTCLKIQCIIEQIIIYQIYEYSIDRPLNEVNVDMHIGLLYDIILVQ